MFNKNKSCKSRKVLHDRSRNFINIISESDSSEIDFLDEIERNLRSGISLNNSRSESEESLCELSEKINSQLSDLSKELEEKLNIYKNLDSKSDVYSNKVESNTLANSLDNKSDKFLNKVEPNNLFYSRDKSDKYLNKAETSNLFYSVDNKSDKFLNKIEIYNLSNSEMANPPNTTVSTPTPSYNEILNSLRVPDAIKDLPKFDGNPRLLHEFLNNVEEILTVLNPLNGTAYSRILLRAIRNKIEGPANEVLNMYGTPLEWGQIRNNLILHYSDKRNETSLIRDLHNIRQNNKTVEKFYSEVIEILATMHNHIEIHETNASVIKAKRELYSEMCLNTFLTGLREPLGSTIRAMRPNTLAIAFSYCIKEQNIFYVKSEPSINKQIAKKPIRSTTDHFYSHRYFTPQQPMNFPHTMQRTNTYNRFFPSQPVSPNNHQMFQNSNPFYQQQRQNPFNQQQIQNPFVNKPKLPKPEPMDTSSGNSHLKFAPRNHPNSNNSPPNFSRQTNPNFQPRFISKELHNVTEERLSNYHPTEVENNLSRPENAPNNHNFPQELDDYYQYDQQNELHEQNLTPTFENAEIDDQNFHLPASINQLGI